jgi:AcrR family transcriptional regulator
MVRKPNQDRKEKLISSALKLFVSNGVANTSTAAIASDAGCAAGTLFLYFPTKQALIDELALKIGKKQSEYIKSLLNPDFSVMEMFSTIWHGSVHWFMENLEAFQYIQQVRNAGLISVETVQSLIS